MPVSRNRIRASGGAGGRFRTVYRVGCTGYIDHVSMGTYQGLGMRQYLGEGEMCHEQRAG